MTLLEILARDWTYWKGGQRAYQEANGVLIASEGYCFRTVRGHAELASDRETAVVTESKWAAQIAQQREGQPAQAQPQKDSNQ
jgi:hypothetical protein